MSEKYLLITEAADYLRLSKETLYKYVQQGRIPAAKIGRHWRFDKDTIDAWIASRSHTAHFRTHSIPAKEESRTGRRLKVLVVDDDAGVRLILEKWIRLENHHVDLAKNGFQAMERLTTSQYDLVFLDLQMPDLTGDQVLGRLKEYEVRPPVVLITGFSETSMMVQALNYDLLYVLTKPFERKQVQRVLLSAQAPSPFQAAGISRSSDVPSMPRSNEKQAVKHLQ